MSMLGFNAPPPKPTIAITRGGSTLRRPLTATAYRAWQKYNPATSHATADLRLIPWNVVHSKLMRLNPRFFFAPYGDGRIIICIDEVAPKAAAAYDQLGHYDRTEADSRHEIKGPRRAIIMAPSSSVSVYTEIICAEPGHLQVPLARSLVTICRACTEYGAFTWEAAEHAFGLKLRDMPVIKQYMRMTPRQWSARADNTITLCS